MTAGMPHVGPPPDWLLRWCVAYLTHAGPWLVWGLVAAHATLYAILLIQRRRPESPPAGAMRRFVGSKTAFWFVLAVGPMAGGAAMPSPWWIVLDTAVISWVTVTTYWLLGQCLWFYVARPLLRPAREPAPTMEEAMPPQPEGWNGEERRVGPPDRRGPPRATA